MNNLAKVFSAELDGIDARIIEVEVDINVGLHSFTIVGLADKALSEAKERVNSALKNSGVKPPNKENRKITVNLAPADVKKTGSQYDLAIAVGYMLATRQIRDFDAADKLFVGELALDGTIRPVNGTLNIAEAAEKLNYRWLFIPKENAKEAAIIKNIQIIPVSSLKDVINHLEERERIKPQDFQKPVPKRFHPVELSSVKGQENAKRALIIAASGHHNLLMVGPPGAGKSLLAQAIISILPELEVLEAIEVTKIYSAAGLNNGNLINSRPFRSPHHGASAVAVIGGGANPKPGEISLAHRGVLFLDELPEFHRDILEALRQPLENGAAHIARAKSSVKMPSRFMLVAAMNPCPCGYFGDTEKECRCTANEVFRYQKKISGPLLDRIDLQINVPRLPIEQLRQKNPPTDGERNETDAVREQIAASRALQQKRFEHLRLPIFTNSEMSSEQCDKLIQLDDAAEKFLKNALENTYLSARGYYRVLKVARTIADLENSDDVKKEHLAEAFSYRIRQRE